MYKLDSKILKACDIRGVYNKTLFDDDFYFIAKAFASILHKENKKTCVLGYDCRVSSIPLFKKFKQGLIESGIKVYYFETYVSTPFIYYCIDYLKADSAVIITASHNPSSYNGCKFVMKDRIFHQQDITNLNKIIESDEFVKNKIGSEDCLDIKEKYINYLISKLDLSKLQNSKIVWDCANGATSFFIEDFVKLLPSQNILIFTTPDGTFPNHSPDPSKEKNLAVLKQKVIEEKADLGISFDGDGDRVGFIDDKGRYVNGNQLLILLAKDYLDKNKGSKIISEVKASKVFYNCVKEFGGIPIMWKVGHTNQKSKMIEDNIPFGGETSGHIFYKENNYYDDGMFAAIKLLNYIFSSSLPLSSHIEKIPKIISTSEIRLEMNEEERTTFLETIKSNLIKDKVKFIDIDGMRVDYSKGFWLLRKSNTEPHITLYCESETQEDYKKVVDNLKYYISKTNYNLIQL